MTNSSTSSNDPISSSSRLLSSWKWDDEEFTVHIVACIRYRLPPCSCSNQSPTWLVRLQDKHWLTESLLIRPWIIRQCWRLTWLQRSEERMLSVHYYFESLEGWRDVISAVYQKFSKWYNYHRTLHHPHLRQRHLPMANGISWWTEHRPVTLEQLIPRLNLH